MYSFRFQRSSIDTEDDFADNVIIISSSFSPSTAVWPDWVIFERSWSQIFFKKGPNFMMTFWAILKNIILLVKTAAATFWATFVKIWATFYISIWSHCSTVTHLLSMSISSYVSLSIPSLFQKQITFSSSWNSQHHHLFIFYITHHICLLSFVFVYNLLSVFHSLLLTYQHTFLSSSKYIFFCMSYLLSICLKFYSFYLS